jgi:hypothetical protein
MPDWTLSPALNQTESGIMTGFDWKIEGGIVTGVMLCAATEIMNSGSYVLPRLNHRKELNIEASTSRHCPST